MLDLGYIPVCREKNNKVLRSSIFILRLGFGHQTLPNLILNRHTIIGIDCLICRSSAENHGSGFISESTLGQLPMSSPTNLTLPPVPWASRFLCHLMKLTIYCFQEPKVPRCYNCVRCGCKLVMKNMSVNLFFLMSASAAAEPPLKGFIL